MVYCKYCKTKFVPKTKSKTGYPTHASRLGGRKGKTICVKVHRLVAMCFIPNPENKPFVNHIDGVKTNNHYKNLEWVTHRENVDHALRIGLIKGRSNFEQRTLTKEQVKKNKTLLSFRSSTKENSQTNRHQQTRNR